MDLLSLDFALFMCVVMLFNWVLLPVKWLYRLFLLSACYVFYGWMSSLFLLLLAHFSFWTWLLGLGIGCSRSPSVRKGLLVLHVVLGIGGLAFFKYYDLLFESISRLTSRLALAAPLPELDLVVPVGISFFTFQGLSYVIDTYRDRRHTVKNPIDVGIYVAFFPTILSGPIMRSAEFIPQIGRMVFDSASSSRAFSLILTGLAKKLVLSSYLYEHVVQPVFENPQDFSSLAAAIGVLGYSIQILCDFSGYTDLVTGIALLLGYTLPPNFMNPYSARNLKEFWHRWHMSLSFWLRDYLYIPLGGNRRGLLVKYVNIMITMTLGGLWHGARWNFLVWGCFHGVGLVLTHFVSDLRRKLTGRGDSSRGGPRDPSAGKPWRIAADTVSWLMTFGFVTIGWVFFGANSVDQAMALLTRILHFDLVGKGFSQPITVVVLSIVSGMLMHEIFRMRVRDALSSLFQVLPLPVQVAVLTLLIGILLRLAPDGVPQFIYYQF